MDEQQRTKESFQKRAKKLGTWLISSDIFFIGIMIAGTIASNWFASNWFAGQKKDSTEQRIERLTKALTESVEVVNEIQKEIESRSSLATKLQQDIKTYDELVKVKAPEVEAITQALRGEIQKESGRSFWENFLMNSVFFILGVIVDRIFRRKLSPEQTLPFDKNTPNKVKAP